MTGFKLSRVQFDYTGDALSGSGNIRWMQINFNNKDDPNAPAFARFIARYDRTVQPNIPLCDSANGDGKWNAFVAATAQVEAFRTSGSNILYLQFPPLGKEARFVTNGTSEIKPSSGVIMFRNYGKLKNKPMEDDQDDPSNTPMVADYAPDRVVLQLQGKTTSKYEYGLFLPNEPLGIETGGAAKPDVLWDSFTPESASFKARAQAAFAE